MATDSLVQIDAASFRKTMHALDLFAPELRKELVKDLRSIAKSIRSDATGRFPVGKTGVGRGSFKHSVRTRGDDVSGTISNSSRQGMILEFAGSRSSGKPNQGRSLIAGLNARHGSPGRFMWEAYDSRDVPREIQGAVANAEQKLQDRLRRADL